MPLLNINETSIHFLERGKGTPILFVHPPVLTSANFKYQADELSQFFRVITFDIRGHGKSSASPIPLTYPLVAEDMAHIMDALEIEKAFLCGYSMGGSIILEFLLKYPERAWGGIVLSGLSEVLDRRLKRQLQLGIGISAAGSKPLALSISWTNSDNARMFKNLYNEAKSDNPAQIREYYSYGLQYNCTSRLPMINHPVLLIYGKQDKAYFPYAKLLHERLPRSQLRFIDHVKHHIPTKAAYELNDLIKQFIYTHKNTDKPETEIPFIPEMAEQEMDILSALQDK